MCQVDLDMTCGGTVAKSTHFWRRWLTEGRSLAQLARPTLIFPPLPLKGTHASSRACVDTAIAVAVDHPGLDFVLADKATFSATAADFGLTDIGEAGAKDPVFNIAR